jgi:hypothetical protein
MAQISPTFPHDVAAATQPDPIGFGPSSTVSGLCTQGVHPPT